MALNDDRPDCLGSLDKVFPMGPQGLREVTASCQPCPHVKECLKRASESPQGVEMHAERLAGMPARGVRGFLSRWSELKTMRARASGPGKTKRK